MSQLSKNGLLQRVGARWMTFENGAFERMMKTERRLRRIPPHVRLRPAQFDRRLFRLFVATCASLVMIAVAVPARIRTVVILLFFLVAFLVVIALLLVDAFRKDPG